MTGNILLWAMGLTGGSVTGICLAPGALRDDIPAIIYWLRAHSGR